MSADPPFDWNLVLQAAGRASKAYCEMVKASDELANVTGLRRDYVLRFVLPSCLADRRNGKRIVGWVDRNKEMIEQTFKEQADLRNRQKRIEAILLRINLSDEEKALLGIADR